jgi:hypothetical protein
VAAADLCNGIGVPVPDKEKITSGVMRGVRPVQEGEG